MNFGGFGEGLSPILHGAEVGIIHELISDRSHLLISGKEQRNSELLVII